MAGLMRLRVIDNTGDSYELNVGPKALVDVERHFKKPMSQLFNAETASFEALCYVAWRASQLSLRVVKPFDEWLTEIDTIEAVEDEALPLGSR